MRVVRFDDDAIKFLEKLERSVAQRIWNKIVATKPDPHHYFERLVGRSDYKLRIGDYRVIADIDDATITITMIGHRKNIYKNL